MKITHSYRIAIFALAGLLGACDAFEVEPNQLQIVSAQGSAVEGNSGRMRVQLDRPSPVPIEVDFEITSEATYFYDFEVTTASPLVIPEGALTADIEFVTVDDALMEANDETFQITITGVDDPELVLPDSALTYEYTILDDDFPRIPSSGISAYLTWEAATATFRDADLDLIMSYDVNGDIQQQIISSSDDSFEDITLSGTAQDGDYYFDVEFFTKAAELGNDVEYALVFADQGGNITYISSYFLATEVGLKVRLVKVTKAGTTFTVTLIE